MSAAEIHVYFSSKSPVGQWDANGDVPIGPKAHEIYGRKEVSVCGEVNKGKECK